MKTTAVKKRVQDKARNLVGTRVIVRSGQSGVHHGIVLHKEADRIVLADSERLWYWKVLKQTGSVASCSELAMYGVDRAKSRIAARLPWIEVSGICEVIPIAEAAEESFK